MRNVVLCDTREEFYHDIQMRIMLEERDITVTWIKDRESFRKLLISDYHYVFVSENIFSLLEHELKALPADIVYGYVLSLAGKALFTERGIQTVGLIANSSQLLTFLMSLPLPAADTKYSVQAEPLGSIGGMPAGAPGERVQPQVHVSPLGAKEKEFPDLAQTLIAKTQERLEQEADNEIREYGERYEHKSKTKTVAVCSSKGGVGKTTISAQLSTCLALTAGDRDRFRTCVVDSDIRFGNICTTLDFNPMGPTITDWVMDIRQKNNSGIGYQQMMYSKKEIDTFLQYKKDSGLYALIAPSRHTESVSITEEEIDVIFRNLKHNAEMDFLVFDTGNDTSDTTLLAMDYAEIILLVATQDVTCAHCLDLLLKTMEEIRYDMSKIRLVINNVMPAKNTGISVREIQESFAFPCWAAIKHDTSIIKSNNYGKPVVYSKGHDLTKQVRNIIKQLTDGTEQEHKAKMKKGLLSGFRRRG